MTKATDFTGYHSLAAQYYADALYEHTGVSLSELNVKRRYRRILDARGILCYALRRHGLSWSEIGFTVTGREGTHDVAKSSVTRFEKLRDEPFHFAGVTYLGSVIGELVYLDGRKKIEAEMRFREVPA